MGEDLDRGDGDVGGCDFGEGLAVGTGGVGVEGDGCGGGGSGVCLLL